MDADFIYCFAVSFILGVIFFESVDVSSRQAVEGCLVQQKSSGKVV